jgi:oligo-1,6-glucosidase
MNNDQTLDRQWWKEAVVYQIYPRSFNDSDGNGVGDIPGIIEKVEYLDSLDVDVIWLCPVYDSPHADNGYDIRDYRSIADEFGTIADLESLLEELHAHDMRLIMDLVVNHTSDEHEWFQRSRRREADYEEYYYWRDGPPNEPPNNWESFMGGSAWSYDQERQQWYLHLFDEKQPDLNWRNPAVRDDIESMVTWWLEKGIDGFRLDAINYISKADGLPDGDPGQHPTGNEYFSHGPRIHEYLRGLYDSTFSTYDVMTVAEMADTTVEMAGDYLGEDGDGLNMIFHFQHMNIDTGRRGRWDPDGWGEWSFPEFKRIMSRWQSDLQGEAWNAVYLGNHDQPRIVSRFGDDGAYREESATLLATFLLTTLGTPYIYQGDEIGMTNIDISTIDDLADPMTIGAVEKLFEADSIDSYEAVRGLVNYMARDHSRTPMQWSDEPNAGFTDGDPWFEVNENHHEINVQAALNDEDSIWHYYQTLIALRHHEDVFVYGEYELLLPNDEQIYAYMRTLDTEQVLVVLNWSDEPTRFEPHNSELSNAEPLIGNYDISPPDPLQAEFRPYEAVIYRV